MNFKPKLDSKTLNNIAILLALIGASAASIKALTNSDIWLWLRIGKMISASGNFPQTDFLSHTASGREWVVHGWGFGVLTYQIYKLVGQRGLTALRLLISWGVFLILKKRADQLKSRSVISALTIFVSFLIISSAWMLRPHLLGSLFLCLLLLILERYQNNKKTNLLYLIPLITLLWANTHASLPFAFVLMLLLLGSEILENLLRGKLQGFGPLARPLKARQGRAATQDDEGRGLKLLVAIILLSFLTSLINPYHLEIYKYFFKIGPTVKQNILEWLPLAAFFSWNVTQFFLIFLLVHSLALITSALLNPKNVNYAEIALTLISSYLALSALRHIVIAALILTPYLAKNLTVLYAAVENKKIKKFLSAGALAALIILSYNPLKQLVRGNTGISNNLISSESLQFVKEHPPTGEVYNHFNFGSTILWELPQHKTFVDGRVDMFVPDIYNQWLAVARQETGWQGILKQYNVGWIIFPTPDLWADLKKELQSGTWCLVFWDDTASIILKREMNPELCATLAYPPQTITQAPQDSNELKTLKKAYERAINASSFNATAHNRLGMVYAKEGKKDRAEQEFKTAIQNLPQYSFPYLNLAALYQKENPQKSIQIIKEAIKNNPENPAPYQKLAYLYKERLGDATTAERYLKKYKKLKQN